VAQGQSPRRFFWIAGTKTIVDMVTLTASDGEMLVFPDVTLSGGSLCGAPLFVSSGFPADSLTLCDGGQLLGNIQDLGLLASRNAALEMSTAPVQDATQGTGAQLTSMFQTNTTALRATTRVFAERARSTACRILSGIDWNG